MFYKKRPRIFFFYHILFFVALLALCIHSTPIFSEIQMENTNSSSPKEKSRILIDKIAAVVNDEIITLTDIEKAVQFYPVFRKSQESTHHFYSRVLEDLINYKVIYLEYKNEFSLKEEDFNKIQTAIIRKMGSLEQLMSILNLYDMSWQDFKNFIKERVIYEKIIDMQLQVKISIDFKEIEEFYLKEYKPLQIKMELKPKSLIEMTPQIESHLRKIYSQEKLSEWLIEIKSSYEIENKPMKE